MNYLIKHGLLVMACSIGTGVSQSSVAADAPDTATATIDWSQLQLTVTGVNDTAPAVKFYNHHTSLSSNASSPGLNENNSKSVNNWTAIADTDANAGTTYANALASPLSFSGVANSTENGSTSSSGDRTVNFSFDGPGVLTVTVPYTISLTGDPSGSGCYYCYNYDRASVSGHASFNSHAGNGNSSSYSDASFSLNNNYWDSSPESQSGTLVFGIFASGAGNGSLGVNFDLSARAQNINPIPEPESYAMLLAGLGLMGLVVRRRGMKGGDEFSSAA